MARNFKTDRKDRATLGADGTTADESERNLDIAQGNRCARCERWTGGEECPKCDQP